MNIKVELISLVLINSLGFLLAFLIDLSVNSFIINLEWEKKDLETLVVKAQSVRITGAEIFLDRSFEQSWSALGTELRNLEVQYHYLENLKLLPYLNPQVDKSIDIIKNLKTLTFDQYEVLSESYSDIMGLLAQHPAISSVQFISLFGPSIYVGKEDWVRLEFLVDHFRTNYTHLDYSLENSIRIINEELYFIGTETARIKKMGLTLSLILASLMIGIALSISLVISQRIARDMVKINSSLSKMLQSSERIVIAVNRKDELGDLARNIESIFNELMLTRDQLIESEKMASLGELVAGVAHEINTPVGIGVTASSYLIQQIEEMNSFFNNDDLTREQFISYMVNMRDSGDIILSNMQKAANLIKGFKQVAVDQSHQETRQFNAFDYLKDLKRSLKPLYKHKRIKVKLLCDKNLELTIVPGVLSQIITNLLQNAILHAFSTKEEGRIFITVESEADGIQLSFKDNGTGMASEVRDRVFDPFFTTKRGSGGGSGLGLHIVYNLVTQGLGGTIVCNSNPGEGTEFLIHFNES